MKHKHWRLHEEASLKISLEVNGKLRQRQGEHKKLMKMDNYDESTRLQLQQQTPKSHLQNSNKILTYLINTYKSVSDIDLQIWS